ncbi:hypothetical protein D3C78_777460 [compost metagenome]
MIRKTRNVQFLKLASLHNITNRINRLTLSLKLFYIRYDLIAILCTYNKIDTGNIQNLCRRRLRVAACNCDDCIWIAAHSPANNLPAFLVASIRNCTCIDQINVGRLLEIHLLIAFVFKQLPNRLCVIKIHFTTNSVKCNGWHTKSSPFLLIRT